MAENVLDFIPIVGTVYRSGKAIANHAMGDHEEAQKQWVEAGMNAAGDALGLVTGGTGKVAANAARVGVKVAGKVVLKEGVKQGVKLAGRAAARAVRKQLTKAAMKAYAKKYFKKKIKKAVKKAIKEEMDKYFNHDGSSREELVEKLIEGIGATQEELDELDDQALLDLAQSAVDYDEEDYNN